HPVAPRLLSRALGDEGGVEVLPAVAQPHPPPPPGVSGRGGERPQAGDKGDRRGHPALGAQRPE
ncbi:MAG: hypothetical protein JJU25_11425, partial [Halomonas sp.]